MPLQQSNIIYSNTSYPHYFLCNYLPLSVGADPLSLSLLKFKRGRQPDLNAWIDCSVDLLGKAPISPDTILLRALHHDETIIHENSPGALDKLAKTLAVNFHSHYCPRLLCKSSPTPEIKSLPKEQRIAELKKRYYIDPQYLPVSTSPLSFLLLDDILTTGTTLHTIIGALLQSYPQVKIVAFTLAKADYDNHKQYGSIRSQDYPTSQIGNSTVAEEELSTYFSSLPPTHSYRSLTAAIRADAFRGPQQ